MIALVDYGVGNICSVENALRRAGADNFVYTSDNEVIAMADHVILPGVGDASEAMRALVASGLDSLVLSLRQPVLGICVGAQLMCRSSEEGGVQCLGIFDTDVIKFVPAPGSKVPHMGWNTISRLKTPLFSGLEDGTYIYYVHSFYPRLCSSTICVTSHAGVQFSGALNRDNFYATQFHPEKSGAAGERILKNFLSL